MIDEHLLFLADVVLVLHFAIAAFITLGLPIIWLGHLFGWRLVHNPWFRYSHAGFIGVVLFESLAGVFCPLTVWEGALRQAAGQGVANLGDSFVAHWMGQILFYDFDETVFTAVYAVFFVVVALTLWLVPVNPNRKNLPRQKKKM